MYERGNSLPVGKKSEKLGDLKKYKFLIIGYNNSDKICKLKVPNLDMFYKESYGFEFNNLAFKYIVAEDVISITKSDAKVVALYVTNYIY